MKNIVITLSVILTSTLVCDELSWVNEQVEAIKPPRDGMKSRSLSVTKDPFIFLEKNKDKDDKKKQEKRIVSTPSKIIKSVSSNKRVTESHHKVRKVYKKLTLEIIMNNSVMINSKWYRVGDKINEYTVNHITRDSVLLVKKKKRLLLSTKSNHKNLKFKK